jgi:hypothetical protein
MSWADGAKVFFDDTLVLDLQPVAACYDGTTYSEQDIFTRILDALGHTVEQDHSACPLGDI